MHESRESRFKTATSESANHLPNSNNFGQLYIRYRSVLVNLANSVVRNPSVAEEVVQDAFLYLMTSSVELPSDLDALRFLKWKTRMLSLDVVRAKAHNLSTSFEWEQEELQSEDPDPALVIERMEEAAIVGQALAKLSPKQRDALLGTLLQDKSQSDMATEMGISPTAFRQLLFRARGSFKEKLGEILAARGLEFSDLFSMAVRRAKNSRPALEKILIVALALTLPFGLVASQLTSQPTLVMQPEPPSPTQLSEARLPSEVTDRIPEELLVQEPTTEMQSQETESDPPLEAVQPGDEVLSLDAPLGVGQIELPEPDASEQLFLLFGPGNTGENEFFPSRPFQVLDVDSSLNEESDILQASFSYAEGSIVHSAFNRLNPEDSVEFWITIERDGARFIAVPTVKGAVLEALGDSERSLLTVIGTDFWLADLSGTYQNKVLESPQSLIRNCQLTLTLDAQGNILTGSVIFLPSNYS